MTGDKEPERKSKTCLIGYFHIAIAEVRTAEGKLHLYVGINRTSKSAFVQLVTKANRATASAFLVALIAAVPYKIHTVMTDNPVLSDCRRQAVEGGIQFTFLPRYADGHTATYMNHMFDMHCVEDGIDHRLTKIKYLWTNGQVEGTIQSRKQPSNATTMTGMPSRLPSRTTSLMRTIMGGD